MLTVIVYPYRRIRITDLALPTDTQMLEPPADKGKTNIYSIILTF